MAASMIQTKKLIKVGNSFAITIDKAFVEEFFDGGRAPVNMKLDRATGEVRFSSSKVLSPTEKASILRSKVTPEYQAWVEKSLDEDAQSMRELANL